MATTLSFWIFIPKSPKLRQVRLGAVGPDNLSFLLALLAGSRDWQPLCLPAFSGWDSGAPGFSHITANKSEPASSRRRAQPEVPGPAWPIGFSVPDVLSQTPRLLVQWCCQQRRLLSISKGCYENYQETSPQNDSIHDRQRSANCKGAFVRYMGRNILLYVVTVGLSVANVFTPFPCDCFCVCSSAVVY